MATLRELFPGRSGRIELARVILKLCRPELAKLHEDQELPLELTAEIRTALQTIRGG